MTVSCEIETMPCDILLVSIPGVQSVACNLSLVISICMYTSEGARQVTYVL